MSLLVNSPGFELKQFRGATLRDEETDRDPRRALLARNVEFPPGVVQTRRGFDTAFAHSYPLVDSFYFWHPDGIPYLIFVDQNVSTHTVYVRNLLSGANTAILSFSTSPAVYRMICATHGKRVYFSFISSVGDGLTGGYVWNGTPASSAVKCFQRPLLTTEMSISSSASGAGEVSKGTHKVAIVASTTVDYWTKPSPANTSTLELVSASYTAVNSSQGLLLTATPVGNWPAWVNSIQFLLTTAQNLTTFYVVPRTLTTGLGGTATPVTVTVVESDMEIREWEEGEKFFNQISQSAGGADPFLPKGVLNWGDRVVWVGYYGGQDCIFPSDLTNPQRISASRNLLNMTGVRVVRALAVMGSGLYGFSDSWVEAWSDNGDYPVTFGPPEEISTSHGVPGWGCVEGKRDQAYLLAINQHGLWKIGGGGFPDRPLSWGLEPLWQTIDWTVPGGVWLKNDPVHRRLWSKLPIKGGTSHLMSLDYLQSTGPGEVDYSVHSLSFVTSVLGLEIVQNPTKNVQEVWVFGGVVGSWKFFRQKSAEAADSQLYHDDGYGIDSQYLTGPVPPQFSQEVLDHLGYVLRVKGNGVAAVSSYTTDLLRNSSLHPITLSTAPGRLIIRLNNQQSECVSLLITNSLTAGYYFQLSYLKACFVLCSGER